MFRKTLIGLALAAVVVTCPTAASTYISVAPLRPLIEHRTVMPGSGYVW